MQLRRHLPTVQNVAPRWLTMFGGVAVFSLLGIELYRTHKVRFDAPVLAWLLSHRTSGMTAFMRVVTDIGMTEVQTIVIVVGAILLAVLHHPRSSLFFVASGAGAALLNAGLKILFARPRPDELLRIVSADGYAFPSGHSMVAASVYGALAIIAVSRFPRHAWIAVTTCILIVGAVGISRAYLFVHFPSDVVAGWALGLTWPFWLKPAVLGRGFLPQHIAPKDLAADGVNPTPDTVHPMNRRTLET